VSEKTYREYVADERFISDYSEYQRRYANTIRESDRVLIELVREVTGGTPASLLDIGCSTGNLLRHLKQVVPEVGLTGGDLTPAVLDACRADPELEGVAFEVLDLLELPPSTFDVIVANAVLYLLRDGEYEEAAASVAQALRPGGTFLAFDFFHPFEQDLTIREASKTHPDGLTLHFRPYSRARAVFQEAGFAEVEFRPFAIPIDLERPEDDAEIISYTVPAADGTRQLFRGTLYQPWCHFVARLRS
jgi:SAM-dependent methyltransferase